MSPSQTSMSVTEVWPGIRHSAMSEPKGEAEELDRVRQAGNSTGVKRMHVSGPGGGSGIASRH